MEVIFFFSGNVSGNFFLYFENISERCLLMEINLYGDVSVLFTCSFLVYNWTLRTTIIFSQNITVDSTVCLSATSVHCAYQLEIKIHSIIVQALACFSSCASIRNPHSTDMK